jgi:hypothetical protein
VALDDAISSGPAITSNPSPTRLDIFARAPDGELEHWSTPGVRACGKIWVVNLLVSQRPLPGARGDWMFSSSISVASCGGGAVLILVLRAV